MLDLRVSGFDPCDESEDLINEGILTQVQVRGDPVLAAVRGSVPVSAPVAGVAVTPRRFQVAITELAAQQSDQQVIVVAAVGRVESDADGLGDDEVLIADQCRMGPLRGDRPLGGRTQPPHLQHSR